MRKRRKRRRKRARTARRKTTSPALSQRAAKKRRAGSQRTSRGRADSSSWSGTTPPSPTETHDAHTHTSTHVTNYTHLCHSLIPRISCLRIQDVKQKKLYKKKPPFSIMISCCSLRGGTRCSVVIIRLLIFTLYFFIYSI